MEKRLALAVSVAAVGAVVFALPALAQKGFLSGRGAAMQARPHVPSRGVMQGGYLTGARNHRSYRGNRSGIGAYGYLPYYYSDDSPDYYSEQAPSESQPSRIVFVENSQPREEAPPPPPPDSLVLELQGNHWVRITDSGQTEADSTPQPQGSAKASALRSVTQQQVAAIETARELPSAVLVFRDGHKEEVSRYTIVGGTIYTSTDYWNNGSWTKQVPIAELNVPATLETNRERGANFNFPTGPGVVVVRP